MKPHSDCLECTPTCPPFPTRTEALYEEIEEREGVYVGEAVIVKEFYESFNEYYETPAAARVVRPYNARSEVMAEYFLVGALGKFVVLSMLEQRFIPNLGKCYRNGSNVESLISNDTV